MRYAVLLACLVSFNSLAGEPKTFYPLVEDLDEAAAKCGVGKDAVRTALSYPLIAAGMSLNDEVPTGITAYAQVGVIHIPSNDHCVYTVNIRFWAVAPTMLLWNDGLTVEQISLCTSLSHGIWSRSEAARQITEMVEDNAKRCYVEWRTPH